MGKPIPFSITDFAGGMISNPRSTDFKYSQLVKNFDLNIYPKRLYPVRDTEDGDSASATSKKQNFCVAKKDTTPTYAVYALGVKSGLATAEISYKLLTELSDASWTNLGTTAKYQSSGNATDFPLFTYYQKKGLIYGGSSNAGSSSKIWAYDPTGTTDFQDDQVTADGGTPFNFKEIGQGIVHSKDDIFYFPYDDGTNWQIAKNNNGTWTNTAISGGLPAFYRVTSICEYENYIAIAVAPRSGLGNSRVYIWDRDSTLTTLTGNPDWGEGNITIIEEIEGSLIGVSYVGNIVAAAPVTFKGKLVLRQYSGGVATIFNQLIVDSSIVMDIFHKQKINQYLYFPLSTKLNGATLRGIWRIGRNIPTEPFALSLYQFAENDETDTVLEGFFIVGDYVFTSYSDVTGGAFHLSKTNDTASYTATSIYESLIINGGNSRLKKDLEGVTVTTDYLPTDGQVVLKYQIDENIGGTTWITIFTNTTDNSISYSAVTSLPKAWKEIVFRIESTGGAVITGLHGKLDVIGADIYD